MLTILLLQTTKAGKSTCGFKACDSENVVGELEEKGEPPSSELVVNQSLRDSLLQEAMVIIRKYETWHHWPKYKPYVGWGHCLLKKDSCLSLPITREQGDSILVEDLKQKMSVFNQLPFPEQLLLGMLAYNVGEYKIINPDKTSKTRLSKAIYEGQCCDSVFVHYVSFCRYKRLEHALLKKRRVEEFELIRKYLKCEKYLLVQEAI